MRIHFDKVNISKIRFDKVNISKIRKIGVVLIFSTFGYGCIQEHPAISTFTGDMIYSYLKKDTVYSEFVNIIDKSGLKGMLSAYGSYTCLAPTNQAFRAYFKTIGSNYSMDSLSKEELEYLAKTHIIANKHMTYDLNDGVIPNANMNKRMIEIKFSTDSVKNQLKILLNETSQIISKDNVVYNGVIHGINCMLKPSNYQLPELMNENPKISIFNSALLLTGLSDSLRLVKDESYQPIRTFMDEYDTYPIVNPSDRKYGYTVLVESNELLRSKGINTISDLIEKAKELYPGGEAYENNFTNKNNSLNQYISYHLINRAIYLNKFFYTSHAVKGVTPDEFIETMLENRLIRASNIAQKTTLNHNSRNTVHVLESGGGTTVNGVYHLLDNLLVYSNSVEEMLSNTRIRFDFNSLFPELVNNNIRGSRNLKNFSDGDRFGFEQGYLKHVKMSKDTRLIYLAGEDFNSWTSFQGDELMALGSYDITMRLLPVPPGTYELRYGYSANPLRSVTQVYVDGKPIGIPIDLKISANDPRVGWILDQETDDNGYENDKMMRNRGFMKGPTSFCVYFSPLPTTAREVKGALRRIIGTFTFTKYEPHYLRLRSVTDTPKAQLDMDFLEFVPKSIAYPANGEPEPRD